MLEIIIYTTSSRYTYHGDEKSGSGVLVRLHLIGLDKDHPLTNNHSYYDARDYHLYNF